jgi:hypothetical protein
MNHGLFQNASEVRERGGVPVPASIMPLRYAYEAMIVAQATENPFEKHRLRLQSRIDRVRAQEEPLDERRAEKFDMLKEGLRRLLASGASSKEEAQDLIDRIRRIATFGTPIEVETMKVWPEDDPKARPASEFFVNERIDLLVREGETFRNDYRNKDRRIVFHALKKPIPFMKADPARYEIGSKYVEGNDEIETQKYCGILLMGIVFGCGIVSTLIISRQNRQTR